MSEPHLERLFARDFRCYSTVSAEFDPRINVFVGPNGAGKTNLLEAIHYLGLGSSFRIQRDAEAVRWGQNGFFLKGRQRDELGSLDIELAMRPGAGKSIRVAGRTLVATGELFGTMPCVAFTPDDLQWAKGPPGARRRWLDRLLCQTSRSYVDALAAFRQALAQRNSVLQDVSRSSSAKALLPSWTEEYLERAAPVAAQRARALAEIARLAAEELAGLSHEMLELTTETAPAEDGDILASEHWKAHYQAELEAQARVEERRGHTLVGPHRDDVLAHLDGRDARRFASQGQQRSLVVALKLAEVRFIAEALGRLPVLLLDDVFSELDPQRRSRLTITAMARTQTFLTTTEDELVPQAVDAKIFHVKDGVLSPPSEDG